MRRLTDLAVALLALAVLGCPAVAQDDDQNSLFEIRGEIRDVVQPMAFDPSKFFASPYVRDSSVIRITYTGNDYDWPVYAMAIADGCVDAEDRRRDACGSRLRARMVRSPAPPDLTRPRQRGLHLLNLLADRRATSPDEIRRALAEVGVEWLEADLRTCPGATEALRRSKDITWTPNEIAGLADERSGDEPLLMVIHADKVRVEFEQFLRLSTYYGYSAPGSPAAWAVELAAALEPCWRPATVPPPWTTPVETPVPAAPVPG